METKSIRFNLLMNVILKASAFIFPLITLPYVARVLGVENNGKISFATSVISYFSLFSQLGIPTYGIRACARVRESPQKLKQTVTELVTINAIFAAIAYITLAVSIFIVPKFHEQSTLLMISSARILLTLIGMEWFYQAIEQYQYITVRNLLFKFISLLLLFALVKKPEDYLLYCGINIFGVYGSYIVNLIYSQKFISKDKIERLNLRQHLKPIFTFFALSLAISIYTNMDTVMLGFIKGDVEVGYYNLATKIKDVLVAALTALGTVLLPRLSFYYSTGESHKLKKLLGKSMHFTALTTIPAVLFFNIISREAVLFLGGEQYLPSVACMQIVTLAILPISFANVACTQILAPMGRERYTMYSTIAGAFVNLVANSVLIPQMGASGAALGTVIAEITVAIIQIYYARDFYLPLLRKKDFGKIAIGCFAAIAALGLLNQVISPDVAIVKIAVEFGVFCIAYAAALLLLKDSIAINVLDNIRHRLEKLK